MSKQVLLDKRAKEIIWKRMEELGGNITKEDVIELLTPHFMFDFQKAREQAIKRKASNMLASYRDVNGIRKCFSCNEKYVNVEKTKSIEDLNVIEEQLNKKYIGLNASKKKIKYRKETLSGQQKINVNTA